MEKKQIIKEGKVVGEMIKKDGKWVVAESLLSTSTMFRIEGICNTNALKEFEKSAEIIAKDMIDDGFEPLDVQFYFQTKAFKILQQMLRK